MRPRWRRRLSRAMAIPVSLQAAISPGFFRLPVDRARCIDNSAVQSIPGVRPRPELVARSVSVGSAVFHRLFQLSRGFRVSSSCSSAFAFAFADDFADVRRFSLRLPSSLHPPLRVGEFRIREQAANGGGRAGGFGFQQGFLAAQRPQGGLESRLPVGRPVDSQNPRPRLALVRGAQGVRLVQASSGIISAPYSDSGQRVILAASFRLLDSVQNRRSRSRAAFPNADPPLVSAH